MKKLPLLLFSMISAFAFAQKPALPRPHQTPNTVVHQRKTIPQPSAATPPAILTYEQLARAANLYATQQNEQNEKIYSLSTHNQGGFRDEDKRTMTLNDSANGECTIHYTEIGFYFPDKNEWSWIWFGNPNIEQVKNYGTAKKMERLTTETARMSLQEATELANAAAYILKAKGVQAISAPDGSHIWFVANDNIVCDK